MAINFYRGHSRVEIKQVLFCVTVTLLSFSKATVSCDSPLISKMIKEHQTRFEGEFNHAPPLISPLNFAQLLIYDTYLKDFTC